MAHLGMAHLAQPASGNRTGQSAAISKIAVFRALRLGDMLCAVPALRSLRRTFPHARITLIGLPWAEQFVIRFRHYVDDFSAFPGHPALPEQVAREQCLSAFYEAMQARRFDLAIQLHGSGEFSNRIIAALGARHLAGFRPQPDNPTPDNPRSGGQAPPGWFIPYPASGPEPLRLLALTQYLGDLDPATATDHLEFPITHQDEQELQAAGLARGLIPQQYICIHPGASMRSKCWSATHFVQVADALADETGLPIVLTGSGEERGLATAVAEAMQAASINAAAPVSIGAMAALMRDARLLICNDTGVSHIAAGLTLPSVVIFSKADMQRWAPLNHDLHRCIWDPDGMHVDAVLENARMLLAATGIK